MARNMKDSGIEWIKSIPVNWECKRGKQLFIETNERSIAGTEELLTVSHITGVTPRRQKNVNMFMSESLTGYKICHPGDIAANTMWLWQGAVGVSNYHGVISPSYNTYRQRTNDYDSKYLDYLLRIQPLIDTYAAYSTGITLSRLRLYPESFLSIYFIVPPLTEQQHISSYLDVHCSEIDAMLSKTRSSIEEYKKLKQAVITQAVTKGVHGNREMKNSGVAWIGEIPRGWKIAPMKHFIDILPGYAFSSNDFSSEDGIPLLRGINVGVNEIRWDETVRWNHPISKQIDSFSLKVNDLVVGLDRPWISDGTRVAFISKKDLPCLLLQRVCRIRIRCDSDIRWIYYWLSGNGFKESLTTETTGISVPHISTKQIEQFSIPFPKQSEQSQICDYLDAKCAEIDGLIAKKEQLVKELESYKKSLIYEVVTGKREV